jgi:hypothetical protein
LIAIFFWVGVSQVVSFSLKNPVAKTTPGRMQTKDGNFKLAESQPWNTGKNFSNTDAFFFDADNDGDPDLYLVSSSADYPFNSKNYQDRIF